MGELTRLYPGSEKIGNYLLVPQDVIARPHGNVVSVYRDYWWVVDAQERVLLYLPRFARSTFCSPQCNLNRLIMDRLPIFTGDREILGVSVMQIPLAFVHHLCND